MDSDEAMPLGQEFQDHIKCFLQLDKKDPKERYHNAEKLLRQLKYYLII